MPRLRTTQQLELLNDSTKQMQSFFDASDLHAHAQQSDPDIGLATVYRYLRDAVDAGRLYKYRCGRRSVYTKQQRSHCHFVCEATGKVTHFDIEDVEFLKNRVPGSISSIQIEVHGVCDDCR